MYKCRCRFEVFALKIFSDFSLQISILAICTYISEKKVITKLKILKCTYCPCKKVMAKPQTNNLHLTLIIDPECLCTRFHDQDLTPFLFDV